MGKSKTATRDVPSAPPPAPPVNLVRDGSLPPKSAQNAAAAGTGRGLECRKCGCRHFLVDHTRKVNRMIVRYRRCRHCGQRMTTCERAIG